MNVSSCGNCLQWGGGRSNLADPAEWPKIRLLNRDFGNIFSIFPKESSKTQSSLNFLQSGPRKFTKSDFFEIGLDLASSDLGACENHFQHSFGSGERFANDSKASTGFELRRADTQTPTR